MVIKKQEMKNRVQKIHVNCHKIFECNLEMKFLFEEANEDEIRNYNTNPFLQLSIQSIHINFCLLAGILLKETEEYSITKFINEYLQEGETKREIWNTIYDYNFQEAWRKVQKLRNKCYAHNDKNEAKVRKEIKLTQKERNIITDGLVKSTKLLYSNFGLGSVGTFIGEEANIKFELKIIKEWKVYLTKQAMEGITASKKK